METEEILELADKYGLVKKCQMCEHVQDTGEIAVDDEDALDDAVESLVEKGDVDESDRDDVSEALRRLLENASDEPCPRHS
jgi:hypothetical protein